MFNNPNKPKYNPNKAWFLRDALLSHLLHLGSSALEELDVSLAKDLLVFLQSILSVLFIGEQDEGVPRGPAIGKAHKQDALTAVGHGAGRGEELQNLLSRGGEWKPAHADDDLILP